MQFDVPLKHRGVHPVAGAVKILYLRQERLDQLPDLLISFRYLDVFAVEADERNIFQVL